ncbi:Hypothetical_protein [Hexamita inflata]|uniref:Hypothetical_protein n=1 Tax=Hexamita inflata TaxID=28002 RepID=A0AA86PZF3_9EUKA|nr:Hypothetical protein HINF_LOCUS34587 [Hexamita inflata]
MPYVIVDNEDQNLEFQWKDDETAIKYNTNDLKAVYQCINVNGSNHSEFNEYELLNRSSKIGIIDCEVDLSQINSDTLYLYLNNCICHNYFNSDIQIDELILVNSQLKVEQLSRLKLKQLSVEQKQSTTFDYWNCGQLQCRLKHLLLFEVQINLSDLSGYWDYASIGLCDITGLQINEYFEIQTLDYYITNCEDMVVFQYIKCNETCIYAKIKDFDQISQISSITLKNYICDIAYSSYYQSFEYINFEQRGTPINTLNSVQQVRIFDCDTLKDKLCNRYPIPFRVHLQDIKIQTLNLDLCDPMFVNCTLTDCAINIAQLHEQWKQLIFENMMFTSTKADCKIIATDVRINELRINNDNQHLKNFEAWLIILSDIEVTSFPRAKKLKIINSSINITHEDNFVESLQFRKCYYINFSVKLMKKLQRIQFSPKKLQVPLNQFIFQRNKIKTQINKNLQRIQGQKWKMKAKTRILNYFRDKINQITEIILFAQSMD